MADRAATLSALGLTPAGGRGGDIAVTGLAVDSRQVRPGTLFAALPGSRSHGASFVPAALAAGATAILTDAAGAALAREALAGSGAALSSWPRIPARPSPARPPSGSAASPRPWSP